MLTRGRSSGEILVRNAWPQAMKTHETRDSNLTGPRRSPNLETCLEIFQNGLTKVRKYKVVQGMSSRCHQKALCFAARPS